MYATTHGKNFHMTNSPKFYKPSTKKYFKNSNNGKTKIMISFSINAEMISTIPILKKLWDLPTINVLYAPNSSNASNLT